MERIRHLARVHLPITHFLADSLIWAIALPFCVWLRFDYDTSHFGRPLAIAVFLAISLQEVVGIVLGQYRRRWRYGSFDELKVVVGTALIVGVFLSIVLWGELAIPRSVPVLATGFSLLGHLAVRSLWRAWVSRRNRAAGPNAKRIVLIGAGDEAAQLLTTLVGSAEAPFVPVAMVDDDSENRSLRIRGVSVDGRIDDLVSVAERRDANTVVITQANVEGSFVRRIASLAEPAGLEVLILPPVERILGSTDGSGIRPIDHHDLLGRPPAEIDPELIAEYVTGRRVLVTGAGGSIGGELCRQLRAFGPSQLLMLDRDENGLHGTQLSIEGRAMLDDPGLLLADIRDARRVDEIFAALRPEIVFHAAALKHLPLLEAHPAEGWKTNVLGTLNLLDAARRHGTDRFVNVSTDKAAAPTSVLGWTKRVTERLTAHAARDRTMSCVSVRFGNVLGSNGSVLKTFEAQAAAGGPLTVTDPEVTRYFMTVTEAVRLVIHAGAIGEPGEVLILDMGEPVRIAEVAEHLAARHHPRTEIVYTGLRRNEKLHEALMSADETGERRHHPLITHVRVEPLDPDSEVRESVVDDPDDMRRIALAPAGTAATIDTPAAP